MQIQSKIFQNLGDVLKDFSVDDMKKTRLCRYVYDFWVDYDSIDVDDVSDIHKYLMII